MKKIVYLWALGGLGLMLMGPPTAVRAQVQQTQTPTQNQPAQQTQQPDKHDSNTLHKIGNAIAYPFKKAGKNTGHAVGKGAKAVEYPVRKAGENASITAHKATGKSSVVHDRQTGQNEIVTPSTTVTPAPNNGK